MKDNLYEGWSIDSFGDDEGAEQTDQRPGTSVGKQPTFKVLRTQRNLEHLETIKEQNERDQAQQNNWPSKQEDVGFDDDDNDWGLVGHQVSPSKQMRKESDDLESILNEVELGRTNRIINKAEESVERELEGLDTPETFSQTEGNIAANSDGSKKRKKLGHNSSFFIDGLQSLVEDEEEEEEDLKQPVVYPEGFTAEDDLNNDGKIDMLEQQIKVSFMKDEVVKKMNQEVKNEFIRKMRREVDFHHKVAFRFEKAYRLSKKNPEKEDGINKEIIKILEEHSTYLQFDPMALFYSLFFCIYFNNVPIFEFLSFLCRKMFLMEDSEGFKKVEMLLDFIELNGIERLRASGDSANVRIYHIIFYQAIDDKLRAVYSKVLHSLKAIQLRDKDGKELLITRDYELIREAFKKSTLKLDFTDLKGAHFISRSYRRYNAAYFEEVLLNEEVDERIANNYRERFIVDQEATFKVLQMYSKMDYLEHFLKVDIDRLAQGQIIELFEICLKYDSQKIALKIYLKHLSISDISRPILDQLIESLSASVQFHEIKLFFLLEHFDQMNIQQLNCLVDVLQEAYFRTNFKANPALHQFNTFKVAMLIYRVSWRIEQKKIYSLITKCQILNRFIVDSLTKYLETFQNVQQLYKFMHEPVLDMAIKKDSLDMMLEMDMEVILNHPVIVEVLNLVYEGQYSVDSQSIYLSHTFQAFFQMETFDLKQVTSRLVANIANIGQSSEKKQASLQFNIWKYCLEQRLLDELILTVLLSLIILYYIKQLTLSQGEFVTFTMTVWGQEVVTQMHLFVQAGPERHGILCFAITGLNEANDNGAGQNRLILYWLFCLAMVGLTTSIVQKLVILRIKENSEIRYDEFILQIMLVVSTAAYIMKYNKREKNTVVSDLCEETVDFNPEYRENLDLTMFAILDSGKFTSYPFIVSMNAILLVQYSVLLLRRTDAFQNIILMGQIMFSELGKFFASFGAIIFVFFAILRLLHKDLKAEDTSLYATLKDIFNGFNSEIIEERFQAAGQAYMMSFQFIARVFFLGFLSTIFVLRYVKVSKTIEAEKRKDIIKLKNVIDYDPVYGAITMTFFPINVVLLPFLIPLLLLKSERLNDSMLKFQYFLLILFYTAIGALIAALVIPLLYLKQAFNAAYVAVKAKHPSYRCQGLFTSIFAIAAGLPIITLSLIVDFLSLNISLMKDEKRFEFKYQQHDAYQGMNKYPQTLSFIKMFFVDYRKKWKGVIMTKEELKKLKTAQYSIVDNFHSFFCRGDKSYTDSMANIRVFNLTKTLGNQSAIPNKQGNCKLDIIEYDVLASIFQDIVMFNFYEKLIGGFRDGSHLPVAQEILYGQPYMNYDLKRHNLCNNWHRNFSDSFSYIAVPSVVRSFTEVNEMIQQFQEETDFFNSRRRLIRIEKMQSDWVREVGQQTKQMLLALQGRLQEKENVKRQKERKRISRRMSKAWAQQGFDINLASEWNI